VTMSNYTSLGSASNDDAKVDLGGDNVIDESTETATMRAIIFTDYGNVSDVVQEKRIPVPTITKPNDVLVQVLYAAMNPVDYKVINGQFGAISPRKPNNVTGCDFCGTVVATGGGPSVRFLDIGQLVFGQVFAENGTFAEYTVCPATNLAKVPSNITPMEAAAMPLVSQTAFQALEVLQIKKTDRLLILGGGTACGLAATQIARNHIGCSEVDVTSSREEMCMKLGATSVVNYREDKWFEVFKDYGFDAIFDCVGGIESWDLCRSEGVLKKNGRFATIVGDDTDGFDINFGFVASMMGKVINRKFWAALGEQSWDFVAEDAGKNMQDVAAMIQDGKLKAVLDDESPFEFGDYMKMFEKIQSHKVTGKLVMKLVSDNDDRKEFEVSTEMDTEIINKVVQSADSAPVIQDDVKEEEEPTAATEADAPVVTTEEEPAVTTKEEPAVTTEEEPAVSAEVENNVADNNTQEALDTGAGDDDALPTADNDAASKE